MRCSQFTSLWSRAAGRDRKNEIANTGSRNEFRPQGVRTLREGVRSSDIREALRVGKSFLQFLLMLVRVSTLGGNCCLLQPFHEDAWKDLRVKRPHPCRNIDYSHATKLTCASLMLVIGVKSSLSMVCKDVTELFLFRH